jgi:hypothetical protein
VDDTYASSHRILESLSRNSHSNDNAANLDGNHKSDDGNPKKHRAKKITQTIETKIESINAARIENEYFVDPMFHKMSKAFDEGGAKGMLMNNIVSISAYISSSLDILMKFICFYLVLEAQPGDMLVVILNDVCNHKCSK